VRESVAAVCGSVSGRELTIYPVSAVISDLAAPPQDLSCGPLPSPPILSLSPIPLIRIPVPVSPLF